MQHHRFRPINFPDIPLAIPATALAAVLVCHPNCAQAQGQTTQRNLSVAQAPAAPVTKGQRLALVIGNSGYKEAPLANPVNDARAVARALAESGFQVIIRENADQRTMQSALRDFGDRLRNSGGAGLFYYAGHGMQIKGRNYLIPVGATLEREDEVAYAAIDAQSILDKMESAGNATNIMILDACRNNPFTRSTRSGQAGLAQMDAPLGTLVAYATAPGSVASDGTSGNNGLYTEHLLRAMRQPGMKVEDIFKQVRAGVRKDSQGKQIPWESTSLEGDFFFTTPPAQPSAQDVIESALWDAVKESQHPAEIRAYLARYPQGRFSELAKRRLAQLSGAAPVSTNTPPQPNPASANALAPAANAQVGTSTVNSKYFPFEVGDTWRYERFEPLSNRRSNYTYRVSETRPEGSVTIQSGSVLRYIDSNGDVTRVTFDDRTRDYSGGCKAPASIPKSTNTTPLQCAEETRWNTGKTERYVASLNLIYLGQEKIWLPLGEFMAEKYARKSEALVEAKTRRAEDTYWFVDGFKHWVANEYKAFNADGQVHTHVRSVLAEYSILNARAIDAIRGNMLEAFSHNEGNAGVQLGDFIAAEPPPSAAPAPTRPISTSPRQTNAFGFTVGDRWRYQVVDKFKKEVVKNYGRKVTGIQPDGSVLVDDGAQRWTSEGALLLSDYKDGYSISQEGSNNVRYPSKLAAGSSEPIKITENWKEPTGSGINEYNLTMKVIGEEDITVPAGSFRSWRVEMTGNFTQLSSNRTGSFKQTCWYVPQVLAYAACDRERRIGTNMLNYDRTELTSFTVSKAQALALKQ